MMISRSDVLSLGFKRDQLREFLGNDWPNETSLQSEKPPESQMNQPNWILALLAAPFITLDEAAHLLAKVPPYSYENYQNGDDDVIYWRNSLSRAVQVGELLSEPEGAPNEEPVFRIRWEDLEAWCERAGIDMGLPAKRPPQPATDSALREALVKVQAERDRLEEALKSALAERDRLGSELKVMQDEQYLNPRVRETLLKIIYGMALRAPYRFDPSAARSGAATAIADATNKALSPVGDDRVLHYLREAADLCRRPNSGN